MYSMHIISILFFKVFMYLNWSVTNLMTFICIWFNIVNLNYSLLSKTPVRIIWFIFCLWQKHFMKQMNVLEEKKCENVTKYILSILVRLYHFWVTLEQSPHLWRYPKSLILHILYVIWVSLILCYTFFPKLFVKKLWIDNIGII